MVETTHSISENWDPPPPYEATPSRDGVDHPTTPFGLLPHPTAAFPELLSTHDGRLDMRVGSHFSQNLEWSLNDQLRDAAHTVPETAPSTSPTSSRWDLHLNIVIQVVGSRGDVQPFVALGNELRKHGHRVRLATHAMFEELVTTAGLEFFSIGGDPVELMSYMVRHPGMIPSMASLRAGDIQRKRASMAEILNGCWRSCLEPDPREKTPFVADAIIANPPSFAHIHCAQALGVPVHLMFTMPWTGTRAFPHPLANVEYSGNDPSIGNLISYHFVEWLTWQGLGDLINMWRRDVLDLDFIPATEGPNLAENLRVPFTYCWSSALVEKPRDWGSHIDVCGFFFREPIPYDPPTALEAFLRSGQPPVYIGFGSIILENVEETLSILLDAIERTGVRAVIASGWCNMQGQEHPNVYYINDCPHEWLFQHVAAVVHHGGAGTTACGLRNGKPTTIIPFFGDQPFWANMIALTGAGPQPIPYKDLTADRLASAITFCLAPETASAAREIAGQINQENGVRAAVASFHAHLPRQKMECDLIPGEPAVWKVKKGRHIIKLSKMAALMLKNQGRLQEKHLERYQTKPWNIEIRRWEPVTAISSASLSTVAGMADAMAGIVIDPYKEYRRLRTGAETTETLSAADADSRMTDQSLHSPGVEPDPNNSYAKQMALASAISLAKFLGRSSRGAFVDLPLAAAEGMRAVPRFYGEKVCTNAPVHDWRSGMVVAWSVFTHGVYEGFTDVVVHTYRGKKKRGSLGVAEGLGKGLASLAFKTGSATIGLVAYPNQGIYRSLRSAMRKRSAKQIDKARWDEVWVLETERATRVDVAGLCSRYDDILSTRDSAVHW
ncbi:uncharacterized protein N7459_008326 [Penicillium hispanicum]|uniref:uncharacterized protein n=1 Tax=Penicillium hispanicum TaxID=1080232 RepID=UPI002541DBF7|nr:uncharacterized protein N7459_008326 [Penicillium hispanicum]KAJ5573899.1 hypothetical protein N7459_008326 [Penicillium hispanicum]